MSLPILQENACGCVATGSDNEQKCLCPVTGFVQIIGRKYALQLLTIIEEKQNIRFIDIKEKMSNISSSTLTIRLHELECAGLISRQSYSETPPRVEYSLTKEGKRLRKSLFSLSKSALPG